MFFDKTLQLQYLIVNVSIRESEVGTTHALLPSRNFHVTSSSTGRDEPPRTAPQPETQGSSVNSDQTLIQPCPATNRSSGSRKMFGVLLHCFQPLVVIIAVTQASSSSLRFVYLPTIRYRTSENAIQQPQSHYLRA